MRVLRSGRSLPEPQLKTLISSPKALSPSITDPSLNTSAAATAVSVSNSRRPRSLRLANSVALPVTVEVNEGGSKRKRSLRVSVTGSSSDAREERYLGLRSRSRVSQRRFSTGSDFVEKQEDMMESFKEGGLVEGVEGKIEVTRVQVDDEFKAMESRSRHESISAEGYVRYADRQLEMGEKKGDSYHVAPMELGYMSMRSGSRVPKRKIGDECVDSVLVSEYIDSFYNREVKRSEGLTPHFGYIEKSGDKMLINVGGIVSEDANGVGCSEENKIKDGLVTEEDRLGMDVTGIFLGAYGNDDVGVRNSEISEVGFYAREDKRMDNSILVERMRSRGPEIDLNVDPTPEGAHEKRPSGAYQKRSRRYSREEKGKEKLAPKELKVADGDQVTAKEVQFANISDLGKQKSGNRQGKSSSRREAARNAAIELAPQFAFFKVQEERIDEEIEEDDSMPHANEEEDWPGPFSTAMKIIAERESMLRTPSLNCSSLNDGEAAVKIPWTPSTMRRHMTVGRLAPTLKDLCLKVLSENAEEIESLEGLPDAIKHNIAMLLCNSRRMSSHFLGLLTKGSPLEILLSDCSWATDKIFEEVFSQCNIVNLKVLQLDFCGRCLPDYVLYSTLAKAPNCLPSLDRLSLKGAYCLSDHGLDAIVASAPFLRSLNLSQCPLITSKGILALAEKLETILQELYIDVCHNVDAMLILPALKKLKCLDVLSVAHLETVTDKFLKNLIPTSGPKMRVLIIAGCCKLTNASIKVIGENCPRLSCLDIRHLDRLNDSAIQYLVNGACPFQTLKLCHGAFSDEALAAFLEASGATMVELVLNNIEKVAGNTALAISRRCSLSLRSLDLSFCCKMTDEALGLIVDSCLNLKILKLFGCTQVSSVFLSRSPITWDNFTGESSDWRMLEHQPENTFDPSSQQKTVLLKNWWLRKAQKGSDENRLAVGGFTECGKAMRIFDSSPIIKRHVAYTVETADGITIRIEGFINKTRTLDNGFSHEASKTFLIGFPTTWADFANGSSWDKSSHAERPVCASRYAEWSKDSLKNVPFEFSIKSEGTILHNVPSTSSTSVRDSDTRLREAIHKFTAWVSMCSSAHMPLVDRGSPHLPEKSICYNNRLHDDESCGVNMRDAHTNNQIQDDRSCGTNLRDAHTGYNYGHTPVENDSKSHEASCTGVHTEGAGCLKGDLHVDGFPEEKSLNHEKLEFIQDAELNNCKKCNGHAVTKGHHDEGVGTCSTSNLLDSVVGKDLQKEETAQKRDEKFDECSTRRPEKVRPGLPNAENLHGEDQKYAKFTAKPVRRSLRLKSLNPENVHGEFQDNCHFLNKTDVMNCANLVSDGSKTCTISQPTDTLVEGCTSSPNLYVEGQKFPKSFAKPVRKSERLMLKDHANLSSDGSKTHARSFPNYTTSKGSPLSPLSSIFLPSSGALSEKNQDGHQHCINTCLGVTPSSNSVFKFGCCDDSASTASLGQSSNDKNTTSSDYVAGLVEITPANSKAVTSQTVQKRMLRCSRKKKDNQTARSRMNVEQNESKVQSLATYDEKISFSSASLPRRKAKNVELSTEAQQTEDKGSHKMGCKTVWVSGYTDDGSFLGIATVDGSPAVTASVVMSTSLSKVGRGRRNKR